MNRLVQLPEIRTRREALGVPILAYLGLAKKGEGACRTFIVHKQDKDLADAIGAEPESIAVAFISDDEAEFAPERLVKQAKGHVLCKGDGIDAKRKNFETNEWDACPCNCEHYTGANGTKKSCVFEKTLRFVIPEFSVGGVVALPLTGGKNLENVTRGIQAAQQQAESAGVSLRGLPLVLTKKACVRQNHKKEKQRYYDVWLILKSLQRMPALSAVGPHGCISSDDEEFEQYDEEPTTEDGTPVDPLTGEVQQEPAPEEEPETPSAPEPEPEPAPKPKRKKRQGPPPKESLVESHKVVVASPETIQELTDKFRAYNIVPGDLQRYLEVGHGGKPCVLRLGDGLKTLPADTVATWIDFPGKTVAAFADKINEWIASNPDEDAEEAPDDGLEDI